MNSGEQSDLVLKEIKDQCRQHQTNEFELYWDMLGLNWYIWGIETDSGKTFEFSFNHLEVADFAHLVEKGDLELIKDYDASELKNDELLRKRFKLKKV